MGTKKSTKASRKRVEKTKSKKSRKPVGKKAVKPSKAVSSAKAAKRTRKAKGSGKQQSGLDAAAHVLKNAGQPMKVKAIVETMLAKGYWRTCGQTPWATIYSSIVREIAAKGGKARFKKTGRGLFAYKD